MGSPTPTPPLPPPCQSPMDLEKCNGNCDDEFDACMDKKAGCIDDGDTSRQCKKKCKRNRSDCKNVCAAATKCPTAPTARTSARRPAIFATSPTLPLRRHYPHDKQGWWERGVAAAVMHMLTPAPRPDPRSSGVGLYI